jgi:transposase-like protein
MFGRNSILAIIAGLLSGATIHVFRETSWAIFVERALEETAHSLHVPKATMVAFLSEILILGFFMWLGLILAFRLGKRERPTKDDPLVIAHREHAAAIAEQTQAMRSPATQTVRSAFSQTQTINNFPPFLGGNMALQLDNVATLHLTGHSTQKITLGLDTVPVDMRVKFDPAKIQVAGAQFFSVGNQQFVFDVHANKRREIEVSGRTFIVTLIQVKRNQTVNVANALEWVFGVSEK